MMDGSNLVFIVGAPRSGTTWLQLLMYNTGVFATAQETHLFSAYLKSTQKSWENHSKVEGLQRVIGLPSLMAREEFVAALKPFVDSVFQRIASASPTAQLILEKTPDHSFHCSFIKEVYPQARFIHIVRDPRAVVASTVAAAKGWGKKWAVDDVRVNTRKWCSYVEAIAQSTECFPNDVYTLKYEDLSKEPVNKLQDFCDWLGQPIADEILNKAAKNCAMENLRRGLTEAPWRLDSEPEHFFRKGKVESWRDEFTEDDVSLICQIAGELMNTYGYSITPKNI